MTLYVLYMASYLVFTTIYMRDIVNSYFTEDETKAHVIGQALKGHWHSKWQRWPYFKGIKLRWLNVLRRQTWLGPALSLRGGWYHWLLDEAWVTEEKNLGGGGLYDVRVRGCRGAGWWEERGHPSPPLCSPSVHSLAPRSDAFNFKTLRQRQTLLPAVSCSSLLGLCGSSSLRVLYSQHSHLPAEQPLLPSNLFLAQWNDLLASCQDQNSLGSIYLFCAHTGRVTSQ